jgi:hypothetical protein
MESENYYQLDLIVKQQNKYRDISAKNVREPLANEEILINNIVVDLSENWFECISKNV